MSIASFMYTGIAGLNSHSQAMSVISDNIANVNTVGFKASRANFSDVLGGVIGGQRAGSGSTISDILLGSTGPRGGRREGIIESAARSAARSVGSGFAREIMRGVLGSILGKRR